MDWAGIPDAVIRPAARDDMVVRHAKEAYTVLIAELRLRRGKARVDLAVVKGSWHGFEITSDSGPKWIRCWLG